MRRIGASITAARRRCYDACGFVVKAAKQYTTAFVRVGFLPVAADSFVILKSKFQHKKRIHHRDTEKLLRLKNESY
jgi:hypothetical protein